MFNRLYLKIYLALLASIVAAAAAMAIFHGVYDPDPARQGYDTLADFAGEVLPPAAAPADEQRRALRRWSRKMHSHMALYSAERELVADVGRPLPPLPPDHTANGRLRGNLTVFAFRLNDGRWLMVQRVHAGRLPIGVLGMLGIIALVVGLGAYPVVRRLTRRLERLQGSVEAWGGGNLATRVAVEGKDEVARLATSFNHSAERIEALVGAQKSLLANASHELRSPLARIRMAVELLQADASPVIRDELKRNIAELDQLIDEVLLASRLDAMPGDGPAQLVVGEGAGRRRLKMLAATAAAAPSRSACTASTGKPSSRCATAARAYRKRSATVFSIPFTACRAPAKPRAGLAWA